MDSEAKQGRTEEALLAVLQAIKDKFKPVLLRAWRRSTAAAVNDTRTHGMSLRERELFLAGFQRGWVAGALDVTRISPGDLPGPDRDPDLPQDGSSSEVH